MQIAWEGKQVNISFQHEVMVLPSTNSNALKENGFEWVEVSEGKKGIKPVQNAFVGGCDLEGRPLYIAKCEITSGLKVPILNSLLGGKSFMAIGYANDHEAGASFTVNGKHVKVTKQFYVLVHKKKRGFLSRFKWPSFGN